MLLANPGCKGGHQDATGASVAKGERRLAEPGTSASQATTRIRLRPVAMKTWLRVILANPIERVRLSPHTATPREKVTSTPARLA